MIILAIEAEDINNLDIMVKLNTFLTLFPMGDNIAPSLSKIQENGRLGLNLWIYTKCGLKFQKNPNQFHMNS